MCGKEKLIEAIARRGLTRKEFCGGMGISLNTLNARLAGRSMWTVPQMLRGAEILGLNMAETLGAFSAGPTENQRKVLLGSNGENALDARAEADRAAMAGRTEPKDGRSLWDYYRIKVE